MKKEYDYKSKNINNKQTIFISSLLILSELINREIFFFIITFYLLMSIFRIGILKKSIKINSYLICVFIIGFTIGLIKLATDSNNIRDFIRDISMFLTPMIYIAYGIYAMYSKCININNIYLAIINASIIIEIRHLLLILFNTQNILNGSSIRGIGGNGSYITAIAIIILLFYKKDNILNYVGGKIKRYTLIAFLLTLYICYLSRTHLIVLLIGVLINVFATRKIKFKQIISLVISTIIVISLAIAIIPQDTLYQFINKSVNSISEISSTIEDWDEKSINNNWRGYEVYRTKELFKDAKAQEVLFGFGFGKRVDLNIRMYIGKELFTSIPILHNGYYYILLKTGIIGVIIYIIFFAKMALKNYKQIYNDDFEAKLLCIIAIAVLFTTLVVTGIYNKGSMFVFCLIIGASFYNKNKCSCIN